ncbi:nucleotidyltransferase [uncultured Aquimarina sp.]|uniref:nucleotidyltransferase domain-containing protein n=1 Tax=uncultured Aquimarina sp. TaxID=575652 RepID=UPI0026265364|nr:nucleotidyltransferase [uncultured Aquimarina sp.]
MLQDYTKFTGKDELNKILRKMGAVLDISNTQHEDAVNKYQAIANYLGRDEKINIYMPDMYPQGSFGLGTVIKPLSDKEEYDIDLVCELKSATIEDLTQSDLKKLIGDRLKSGMYKDMLKDQNGGRRCWTIKYAEDTQLHLDILPAMPDNASRLLFESKGNSYGDSALSITDNKHPDFYRYTDDWVKSNPKGYQTWFKEQMLTQLNESKRLFAATENANVDDVPDYKVKTPLQRAVQLLKRHRDSSCEDNDDKPISIIITTLSAQAYSNEDNLYDALVNILNRMHEYIKYEMKDGKRITVIENPVDSRENFADKWEDYPIREKVFLEWLNSAKTYFKALLQDVKDMQWINESLNKGFGNDIVKKTFSALGNQSRSLRDSGNLRMATGTGLLGTNIAKEKSKEVKKHNFHGKNEK